MAYTELLEIASSQVDLSTTGDKFRWGPSAENFVIIGYTATLHAAAGSGAIALALRPTYGSDTGRATQDTVTITSTVPAGGVAFRRLSAPVRVSPGQEVVVAVSTAVPGNTAGKVALYGYYDFDTPANLNNVRVV